MVLWGGSEGEGHIRETTQPRADHIRLADEIADETRGLGEDEPPSQWDAAGFGHSHDSVEVFGTVLAQPS